MTYKWYKELYICFNQYDNEPYTKNTKLEVDFIEKTIGFDHSKRILDIGCGTGRHSLELARRGYSVVGFDLSEAFIEKAKQIAKQENLDVQFLERDARILNFKAEFDVAIDLCEGAFSMMETDEMELQILANASKALTENGTFILTAPHAAFMIAHDSEESKFDLSTLREDFQIEAVGKDGTTRLLDANQRYYTCPELKWMLKSVDFKKFAFFPVTNNGYDLETALSSDHFEFGVIARK